MNVELHLLVGGVDKGPLPSYQSLSLSPVYCDIGAISFKYPRNGKRFNLLDGLDELEIVPWVDGVIRPEMGGYVNQIAGDDVADTSVIDFAGQTYLRRMDEIRVYPAGWPAYNPNDPSYLFSAKNPGQIAATLMQAAQARGTATDITYSSFSPTVDSKGVAWTKIITMEVKPGSTMLDVLTSMHANNMIEFEMVGKDLRVYNYGAMNVDRTVQANPLTFRRGRDLSDSPRKVSSRDVATVMLAAGKEDAGLYKEEVDNTAIASRRRIEGFVSNGNIIEAGTLEAFTEANLQRSINPLMEKTHGLALSSGKTPKPFVDFNIGDWAYSDTGKGLEKLRIKQWVINIDSKGNAVGSVSLNDLISEQNAALSRRIDRIVGGSTITGESKAVDAVPPSLTDGVAPAAPTGLAMSSSPFVDVDGQTWAQITASWAQVTTNADASIIQDLAGYEVQWEYLDVWANWQSVDAPGLGTQVSWSPAPPNTQIQARVRAYDQMGNIGAWSATVGHTTAGDATPPEKPATPTADNYMGLLRVVFNGNSFSGAAWAPDTQIWKVHASTINNFTPSNSTWVDTLTSKGESYLDVGYGQTRYFKIQAVDRSGNHSVPSDQASATSSQVVSADIFDGAVGSVKLADAAVISAKIDNLAVNDAHIGSVNAGKITAGIINAALTVSGRIATALTGARSEMNGTGFQSFDASGNITVSLTGATNLLTGRLLTAISGRRIDIGASGSTGEISFYAPDGTRARLAGFTSITDPGVEVLSMSVVPDLTTIWQAWPGVQVESDGAATQSEVRGMGANAIFVVGGNGPETLKNFTISWATTRGTPTSGPVAIARFQITATQNGNWFPNGGSFHVTERDGDLAADPAYNRFTISHDDVFIRWSAVDRRVQFKLVSSTNSSPSVTLFNENNFGGLIKYHYPGGAGVERIEMRGWGDTYDIQLWCSSVVQSSSETVKEDIVDFNGNAMELLRPVRVTKFRRKRGESTQNKKQPPAEMELGAIAETIPAEAQALNDDGTVRGFVYGSLMALHTKALVELDDELKALRAQVKELVK